jgi:hypothetical protein
LLQIVKNESVGVWEDSASASLVRSFIPVILRRIWAVCTVHWRALSLRSSDGKQYQSEVSNSIARDFPVSEVYPLYDRHKAADR